MTINDSNWQFLHDATGLSLPFNEMYFRYLRDLGYEGTLQDMIAASGIGLNPSGLSNPASQGGLVPVGYLSIQYLNADDNHRTLLYQTETASHLPLAYLKEA